MPYMNREGQNLLHIKTVRLEPSLSIHLYKISGFCRRARKVQNKVHHSTGSITKTCLYNFDPLKPHFYIVKLGFAGVYIIFLISAQNIDCGYSLEPPRQGGSKEYPKSMF